jgi:hypothetical protein
MKQQLELLKAYDETIMKEFGLELIFYVKAEKLKEKDIKETLSTEDFAEYRKQKQVYFGLINSLAGGIGISEIKEGNFKNYKVIAKKLTTKIVVTNEGKLKGIQGMNRILSPEDIFVTNKNGYIVSENILTALIIEKSKALIDAHPEGLQQKMLFTIAVEEDSIVVMYRVIVDAVITVAQYMHKKK